MQPQIVDARAGVETGSIAALVAAAGESARMGRPKALLRWRHEPLVRRLVRVALAAGASPCVVTVPGAPVDAQIREALRGLEATIVANAAPALGLIGSVRTALDLVGARALGLALAPVDAPFISTPDFMRLLDAARAPGAIAVPQVGALNGHPVVFERALFEALRSSLADQGAARLIEERAGQVVRVPCDDPRLSAHLNTPEDARALGISLD